MPLPLQLPNLSCAWQLGRGSPALLTLHSVRREFFLHAVTFSAGDVFHFFQKVLVAFAPGAYGGFQFFADEFIPASTTCSRQLCCTYRIEDSQCSCDGIGLVASRGGSLELYRSFVCGVVYSARHNLLKLIVPFIVRGHLFPSFFAMLGKNSHGQES